MHHRIHYLSKSPTSPKVIPLSYKVGSNPGLLQTPSKKAQDTILMLITMSLFMRHSLLCAQFSFCECVYKQWEILPFLSDREGGLPTLAHRVQQIQVVGRWSLR